MKKCLICGDQYFPIRVVDDFVLNKCVGCGVEFVYPQPTDGDLAEFYKNYVDVRARNSVLRRNAEINLKKILDLNLLRGDPRILDYGCGENVFIQVCRDNGFLSSYGYDPFVSSSNNVSKIGLTDLMSQTWDIVSMWGVLEHLLSPKDIVKQIRDVLSDDGAIFITTLSIENKIPFQYKPPEHVYYFTKKSIEILADHCGLEVVSYFPYVMQQNGDVYFSIITRTVPQKYKSLMAHSLPEFVTVPTNEVFVIMKKKTSRL